MRTAIGRNEASHRHQRFPQEILAATAPAAPQSSETLVVDHDENDMVRSFSTAGSSMTLEEILQSIHALEGQLRKFEEQYGLRSEDFYRLVQEGRLEQSADFIEWLGLYEIKCQREQSLINTP